jgi:hypothetical protein
MLPTIEAVVQSGYQGLTLVYMKGNSWRSRIAYAPAVNFLSCRFQGSAVPLTSKGKARGANRSNEQLVFLPVRRENFFSSSRFFVRSPTIMLADSSFPTAEDMDESKDPGSCTQKPPFHHTVGTFYEKVPRPISSRHIESY